MYSSLCSPLSPQPWEHHLIPKKQKAMLMSLEILNLMTMPSLVSEEYGDIEVCQVFVLFHLSASSVVITEIRVSLIIWRLLQILKNQFSQPTRQGIPYSNQQSEWKHNLVSGSSSSEPSNSPSFILHPDIPSPSISSITTILTTSPPT